jgi:hypothetical protein
MMKYLKRYNKFFEDGTACANASNTGGMGAVSAATPGVIAGTTGLDGSGDVGFILGSNKKKRKKGNPSEVSDLRDLKDSNIKKVEV